MMIAVSEATIFSPAKVRSWLETETGPILTPVQEQAQKLRDEMRDAIQNLSEVSRMLLDNSAKEIEKRNMRVYNRARALNKLARLFIDRLKKLTVPDEVSYDNLSKFAQETQKVFIVTDIDIKNWFPRISPFFIMDRRRFQTIYDKTKESLTALNNFLSTEYIKTKTLEETLQLIDDMHNLEDQLSNVKAEKTNVQNERLPIEKEIAELEQKIANLQNEGPVDQLFMIEAEIEKLNKEIKHSLRHLQKAFKKLNALAYQGGGAGLTPDELAKLEQYFQTPFRALSREHPGYPMLKQILQKTERLMNEGKLKLKSDKARKAEKAITSILKRDSLANLYRRSADTVAKERTLLNSTKMEEIKHNLTELQEQTKLLKARKSSVEAHESVKERAYNELLERLHSTKRTIEKNVLSSINKQIHIE